ncbi:MAG: hypothetical protein KF780_00655 [Sphingomonas sp.]|nr:hypothetical protein [Sphingomonas sp.]
MKQALSLIAAAAAVALPACATAQGSSDPQAEFMAALNALCGNAYEGRVVTNDEADRDFAASRLVMHVRQCAPDDVRVPFHVGEDRSRTWVITRTADGLRLKHDHRHEDGSEDVLTQYGGDTANAGTATRQEFPADQFSRDLFVARDIPQSATNVWAVEVVPGRIYAYELRRPNRFLRVEFDLTRPVTPPPAPWGHE